MIDWRDITLEDKAAIEDKICASGCHGSDYGFTNLYIWRKAYKPKIAFCDDRLLVGMPQWNVYAYPKGGGEVRNSIELLLEEAHGRGNKLRIRGLTDKTLDEFLPLYGDRFEISEDRNNADYIYTTTKLCELPGRHLSSKRNHIKHFERNGEWEFHKIAANSCGMFTSHDGNTCGKLSSIEEAKAFVDEFYKEGHRSQIRYLGEKLMDYDNNIGLRPIVPGATDSVQELYGPLLEEMSEWEHERWMQDKLADGWRYGRNLDPELKLTPDMVPYDELEPRVQEFILKSVRNVPEYLEAIGYELYRKSF